MSDRKTHRPSKQEVRRATKGVRKFALRQKGGGVSDRVWAIMTPKEARRGA